MEELVMNTRIVPKSRRDVKGAARSTIFLMRCLAKTPEEVWEENTSNSVKRKYSFKEVKDQIQKEIEL